MTFENLIVDGSIGAIIIGTLTFVLRSQDILRTWLYKKLMHNQPMNQKDYARQMMANEHELEQIRHDQQKSAELAKLAIFQANQHVMEQRAQAHVTKQAEQLLALPVPSPSHEPTVNGVAMPPLVTFDPEAEAPKNGKATVGRLNG